MKVKAMVIIGFLVAFAAGLTVGLEARQTSVAQAPTAPIVAPVDATSKPTTRQSRGPDWIERELKLDADQKQKMNQIWSSMARDSRAESDKRRQQLRDDRDAAIHALLGPDNKTKYDEIQQTYRDQQQTLDKEMRARFEKAVADTMSILTPEQQTKYKEILARHRPPDGGRGGPRGGPNGGSRPSGGPERDNPNFEHRRGSDASATSRPTPP